MILAFIQRRVVFATLGAKVRTRNQYWSQHQLVERSHLRTIDVMMVVDV